MKIYITTIGILMISSFLQFGHASADELTVGSPAPAFELQDQNYKLHKLEDYRGKWLVLYFYPKDDTPGCTKEACKFRDDIFELRRLKVNVIGVSLDDSKSHEEFAEKYKLPFPLLADVKSEVSSAYGALLRIGPIKFSKRHTFIIGPDGLVKKIYRKVDPDQHSQQVITELKLLMPET